MIEPAQASFYAREWSEDARFLIEEIKGYLIHLTMPLEFFANILIDNLSHLHSNHIQILVHLNHEG